MSVARTPEQKARAVERVRQWRAANPDKARALRRRWAATNREKERASGAAWAKRNPASCVAKTTRHQLRKRQQFVEDVNPDYIYLRDQGYCRLCGGPVQFDNGHASQRTLDHVVPISLGGEHSYANVRLAHRSCNSSRSNRIDEGYALAVEARVTEG